jgi:hypothetical protein
MCGGRAEPGRFVFAPSAKTLIFIEITPASPTVFSARPAVVKKSHYEGFWPQGPFAYCHELAAKRPSASHRGGLPLVFGHKTAFKNKSLKGKQQAGLGISAIPP